MKCSKCKQEKSVLEFHKNAKYCKLCRKQYNAENSVQLKERRRLDYLKNKEIDDLRNAEYYKVNKITRKQYYEDNKSRFHDYYLKSSYGSAEKQITALVNRTKRRAVRNEVQFDLDVEFVSSIFEKQNGQCLLTGIVFDLEQPQVTSIRPFSMSLDRIESKLGYTKNNVRLVCAIVNFAINEFGLESFDKMCQNYLQRKK